jgi:D-alanyl-D-alanine carboxypeptidase/D-alanyl-D-alanine-endopeptidase (penicillin-binding protein 4)
MRLLGLLLALELAFAEKKPKLPVAMEQIVQSEPVTARAHLGMRVVEIRSGKVLYERNPRAWFVPASNTKLYSTALALTKFGPDHRFDTQVVADGKDLRLVGGGDPTLSGRKYPYERDADWGDGASAIEQLADALVAKGLKLVEGSVIGDDTRYVWDPVPPGWGADDGLYEYGAPVSALMLNDNTIRLKIRPGSQPGEPAALTVNPAFEYFAIQNRIVTAEPGTRTRIRFERPIGTREVWLDGTIAVGAAETEELLAVDEPARFAAQALVEALRRRGVEVRGGAGVRHRFGENPMACDSCEVLAERKSPPLSEVIQVVNKVSQNLHAEIMRREGGGQDGMKALFASAGITDEDTYLVDGSGLSRLTLVCPESSTKILLHLWNSPHREPWLRSLPIGAEDGTLENRFKGFAEAGRVKAKTGSLTHVAALAGYLDHPKRGMLAFSVMVNNYNGTSAKARAVIDKLVMKLLEY